MPWLVVISKTVLILEIIYRSIGIFRDNFIKIPKGVIENSNTTKKKTKVAQSKFHAINSTPNSDVNLKCSVNTNPKNLNSLIKKQNNIKKKAFSIWRSASAIINWRLCRCLVSLSTSGEIYLCVAVCGGLLRNHISLEWDNKKIDVLYTFTLFSIFML